MKKFNQLLIILVTVIYLDAYAADPSPKKIDQILRQVKADLLSGRIEDAKNILTEASGNFHSVSIELATIQTLMQAGEYIHALSAAAHTQAEHSDDNEALLFYAWLVAIGGQDNPARNLLKNSMSDNANLLLQQIERHQLNVAGLPLSEHIYFGPIVSDAAFNHRQNAIILADGLHALTVNLPHNKTYVVRTSTGELINAELEKGYANSLCLIKLDHRATGSLSGIARLRAGTPVFIANLAISSQARWPELKADVTGFADATSRYPLHLKNLAPGSGVYNSAGELVGLVGLTAENNSLVIPITDVLESTSGTEKPNAIFTRAKPIADIYQTALQQTLAVAEATSKE